jgi:hypothetical protein
MGWVSYLEDITERLNDDLAALSGVIGGKREAPKEVWVEVQTVLTRATNTLRDLLNHLDLATDPDVKLYEYAIDLERKNRQLESDLAVELHRSAQLTVKLDQLNGKLADAKTRLKSSEKVNKELQAKLAAAFISRPDDIYAAYSTPDRIKRLKPDG